MPRKSKIRYKRGEREQVQNLTRRASAKIRRITKEFGDVLPPDIKTLRINQITTRKQLNEYVEKMESFTNRYNTNYQFVKNEQGVVTSIRKKNEIERTVARVNRIKAEQEKKRQKTILKDRGKETTITTHEMGRMGASRFRENKIKFNFKDMTKGDFANFVDKIESTYSGNWLNKKNQRMKDNYVTALQNVFGRQAQSLWRHIEDMSLTEFMEMWEEENLADIDFIYDEIEAALKLQAIRKVWGI